MKTCRQLLESYPRIRTRDYFGNAITYSIRGREVIMLQNDLVKIEGYEPLTPEQAAYILGIAE